MDNTFKITKSELDEYRFDTINYEHKLSKLDPFIVKEANQAVDKIIDKYLNEETTATKVIWWVLIHPIQDIRLVYYFIIIIGVFMNNFLGSWRSTLPAVISALLGLLGTIGITIPESVSGGLTLGLIGWILLVSDWTKFIKEWRIMVPAMLTLLFAILAWVHVFTIAPAVVTILINFIVFLIGSFLVRDQEVTNVIKDTKK